MAGRGPALDLSTPRRTVSLHIVMDVEVITKHDHKAIGTRFTAAFRMRANRRRAVLSRLNGQNRYSLSWVPGVQRNLAQSNVERAAREASGRHFAVRFFLAGQSDGALKVLLLTTLVAQTESVMPSMRGHGFARIALRGSSFGGWKRQLSFSRGAHALSRYRFKQWKGDR